MREEEAVMAELSVKLVRIQLKEKKKKYNDDVEAKKGILGFNFVLFDCLAKNKYFILKIIFIIYVHV